MSDDELIHQYVSDQSEGAFRALVERYLPLVYTAALRQVGNAALAEDVTQVVFIILAKKACKFSSRTLLPGWLFRTTRHAAAKALRGEWRRQGREREAHRRQSIQSSDVWDHVAPFLDEALGQLGELDRGALLLHFFQNKRLREVGLVLGLSEDAAQKRVTRGVEKLRRIFLKRGVAVPAVVLPGLLMSHAALPAPSYLATQVVASGLSKGAISTSVCAVLREAIVEPLWRRMGKTFVRVTARTAVVAIVVGFGLYLWPKPARSQPSAFAFDTGITMRTPVAPQPLEMEALASAPIYNNPPQPTIPSVIDVVSSKPVTVVAPPANPPATTNQPTPWAVDAKLDQTTPAFNSNAVVTQSDPQSTSSYESASPGWPRIQYRQVTLQYLARQRTLPTAYPTNLFLWAPAQSQPSIRVIGSGSSARPARKKQN